MNKKKLSMAIAIVLATTNTMADDNKNDSATLDEIIVTANKMEGSIKDVPASISVINDLEIEDKGINNISDVVKQIPNLSKSNLFFQSTINFRGINQSGFSLTNPVVIVSDGVPSSTTLDYDVMLENAERIEVLRGPQGSLYGKSSIGGVINIISKEPENLWRSNVGLQYGSNQHMQAHFNTNGSLIDDKLFLALPKIKWVS